MKKSRLILIILSVLILLGCIGMMAFLLFFNYQNVRLFKQAESNFLQGDDNSLLLAETQLLEVVQKDSDNESAFIMLGEIARKRKIYPEQVYYCYMACRLNPLSREIKNAISTACVLPGTLTVWSLSSLRNLPLTINTGCFCCMPPGVTAISTNTKSKCRKSRTPAIQNP